MSEKPKFRFRKIHIALLLFAAYIVMCQSCMTMRTTPSEAKKYFEKSRVAFTDKTLMVEGNPIHYIQTGNPNYPTLFFIHGSPGSWNAFQKYLADSLLLRKYRMISIDRPGFGYSDFGRAENLAAQTKWISQFIDSIDNKKPIVLVGHSLGGPVAAKLATQNPEKYKNLVILSGAVDPAAEKTESWRYYIKMKPFRYLIPGALRPSNDELWWLKKDLSDMVPDLKKITSDVTIIHGREDPLVPYSNVPFMEKEFVHAKSINTIAIEGANHFIPWEHYDLIRDALLNLRN